MLDYCQSVRNFHSRGYIWNGRIYGQWRAFCPDGGGFKQIRDKTSISQIWFSDMALYWLAAVLPSSQKGGLRSREMGISRN